MDINPIYHCLSHRYINKNGEKEINYAFKVSFKYLVIKIYISKDQKVFSLIANCKNYLKHIKKIISVNITYYSF